MHDISKFGDIQSMLRLSLMLDLMKLSMGFEINSYFIQISRIALGFGRVVKGVSVHDISKFQDNQSMLGISLMLDLVKLSMGFEINSNFIQISRIALGFGRVVKGVSVHDISKFEDNQSMLGISLMLDLVKLSMGFEINSYFIQISRLALEIWLRS